MVLSSDWCMVLLLVSTNECVALCHSEEFLVIFIAVTGGWRHFILLLHSLFLIIWPWLFPIWCCTLLILTRLFYSGLLQLIIVLRTLSRLLFFFSFSFCYSFFSFTNPFIPSVLLFLLLLFQYRLVLGLLLLLWSSSFLLTIIDCWKRTTKENNNKHWQWHTNQPPHPLLKGLMGL